MIEGDRWGEGWGGVGGWGLGVVVLPDPKILEK